MITETIIKAAEKAMPFEEKIWNKFEKFFGKNACRLVVSGITALVLTPLIYELNYHTHNGYIAVLMAILGVIDLMAIGAFFANIEAFSMKMFGISVGIASVMMYVSTTILSILSGLDLTVTLTNEEILSIIARFALTGIFVCGIATTVSILAARFVIGNKKRA